VLGVGSTSTLFLCGLIQQMALFRESSMSRFKFSAFVVDESGATSIEYALIAGIVSISIIGAVTGIKNSLNSSFNSAASSLQQSNP
jgi:pilus assembly protein Flp/PilA